MWAIFASDLQNVLPQPRDPGLRMLLQRRLHADFFLFSEIRFASSGNISLGALVAPAGMVDKFKFGFSGVSFVAVGFS